MACETLKVVRLLSLLFSCALWIRVEAVPQEPMLSTTHEEGHFCYIVRGPDAPAPENEALLTVDEKILWGSSPAVSLFMLVNATLGEVYEAATGTVKLGAEHLTEGAHDLAYSAGIGEAQQRYLSVLVDGEFVAPQNTTSHYRLHDSSFVSVTVSAKGPVIFRWNRTCEDPTDAPRAAVTQQSTTKGSHRDSVAVQESAEVTEASQSKTVSVVLWVFIGIASAGLLLVVIVGLALLIQKNSRTRHDQLVRMAEAERQKQTITNAAQRLSYIEQIKWTADDRKGEAAVHLMSK